MSWLSTNYCLVKITSSTNKMVFWNEQLLIMWTYVYIVTTKLNIMNGCRSSTDQVIVQNKCSVIVELTAASSESFVLEVRVMSKLSREIIGNIHVGSYVPFA